MTTTSDPGFPKVLTAEMLRDFQTTERGCTHPRVGTINGHRFIAKCGSWSAHSSDQHVHNEYVADHFLRAAGLNVPFSCEYMVDFGGLRQHAGADHAGVLTRTSSGRQRRSTASVHSSGNSRTITAVMRWSPTPWHSMLSRKKDEIESERRKRRWTGIRLKACCGD